MAYDKKRLERGCPVGKMVADKLEEMGSGDNSLETRVDTLEGLVEDLTDKLQAVLDATAADSTKTLKIDTDGNVELVS